MSETVNPLAGHAATEAPLVDIAALVEAYYSRKPDPSVAAQRVAFGTSGHRGSSFDASFNENHVLAITQAICESRRARNIDGPLFIGVDTHALSAPAFETALEVLAANGVETMIAANGEYTPTPAISQAILVHNRGRERGFADGIVVTPSHNPPGDGGFKYNPPNGGPADTQLTAAIEARANALIAGHLAEVRRVPLAQARQAATTHEHDFIGRYVDDLGQVIDFDVIRAAAPRIAVDPLGGAGVHYWARIAERHRIALEVISEQVDPTFAFMTLDWDGRVRMDPSSKYAMRRLIGLQDRYDVAFACDTDHDRHGIVAGSAGLLLPNHYLAVMIDYLFRQRPQWNAGAAVGKTVVSSALIDRVAQRLGRRLLETPVGFKWFVDGLLDGSLGFGGEESAGASFLRRDGTVWSTDKDGIAAALLSAEMTARSGRDPGELYEQLAGELGRSYAQRIDAPATREQKKKLAQLSPARVESDRLAGETINAVIDRAPGNDAPIGGIKVIAASGWFAARPSGTEDIYKIYAESFRSEAHLADLLREAQTIVDAALATN
ncbi:MAG TPA: phosphoglucomutase (alpha-D-glucose-1,6-bisphosphate-dependent) [Dokdonella sp.]